ncbi:MAG: VVA0879 family protein, partial [Dehalococcoidia bacterium]
AWRAEAERLFGADAMRWRFECPACHHVATLQDWKDAGAPQESWAFSCVGRWLPFHRDAFGEDGPGPCNYAGGGLFRLNPQPLLFPDGSTHHAFAFARPTCAAGVGGTPGDPGGTLTFCGKPLPCPDHPKAATGG